MRHQDDKKNIMTSCQGATGSVALWRLRSRAGETIAETLVALLIAALALTMLAGAISAASGIVTKSRVKLNEYYNKNETTVVEMSVAKNGAGNVPVTIRSEGINISFPTSETVTLYENDVFSNSPVIAYKKDKKNKE